MGDARRLFVDHPNRPRALRRVAADDVPSNVQAQRGYRALRVRGPLDFSLVGIVADLSAPLAGASISIFVVSTYGTDYLLVREADLDRGIAALRGAGHAVTTGA